MNDRAFYIKQLKSNECYCGESKKKRFAFCYRCYNSLPMDYQTRLWQKIGCGFEDAYEEACIYIEEMKL